MTQIATAEAIPTGGIITIWPSGPRHTPTAVYLKLVGEGWKPVDFVVNDRGGLELIEQVPVGVEAQFRVEFAGPEAPDGPISFTWSEPSKLQIGLGKPVKQRDKPYWQRLNEASRKRHG